jgi:PPOX class probable FMN-dependent enzyme
MGSFTETPGDYPGWYHALNRSLDAASGDPTAGFVQLATVADGPANRTIVFRGFLRDTWSLTFVTDCRSDKVAQLRANSAASGCWYFPSTREQYRLSGTVRIVDSRVVDGTLRDAVRRRWDDLSDSTKGQFTGPPPGSPRATLEPSGAGRSRDARSFAKSEDESLSGAPLGAPATFCMLILDPTRVDYLRVDSTPHRRTVYHIDEDGNWRDRPINP